MTIRDQDNTPSPSPVEEVDHRLAYEVGNYHVEDVNVDDVSAGYGTKPQTPPEPQQLNNSEAELGATVADIEHQRNIRKRQCHMVLISVISAVVILFGAGLIG
jgi:hypothetical protein